MHMGPLLVADPVIVTDPFGTDEITEILAMRHLFVEITKCTPPPIHIWMSVTLMDNYLPLSATTGQLIFELTPPQADGLTCLETCLRKPTTPPGGTYGLRKGNYPTRFIKCAINHCGTLWLCRGTKLFVTCVVDEESSMTLRVLTFEKQ